MRGPEAMSESMRDRIFDAVLMEVTKVGIDDFTVEGVAFRADVDTDVLYAHWRDRRVLLLDALIVRSEQANPCPDTGSLSKDLRELGASLVLSNESKQSRELTHRVLPGGRDADFGEIGRDLLAVRFESLKPIFHRAVERGELRAGVDPDAAIQMFCIAALHDPIFYDAPIRPDFIEQVREIFLYGILAPQIQTPALIEDLDGREHMRALLRATCDAAIDPIALLEAVRDMDGRITDFTFREANPAACEYLRLAREQLIGSRLTQTLPEIESSGLLARYTRCVETGEPLAIENLPYFSQRYQQIRRYDLRGGRAGTEWLSMTWRDVTERTP